MSYWFKVLAVFFCLTNAAAQAGDTDSADLKLFWKQCITPIIEADFEKLEEVVHFPLKGDWGYILELDKEPAEWTREDFFDNFDQLFTAEVRNKLVQQDFRNIENQRNQSGEVQCLVGINWKTWTGEFMDESGLIFRFKQFDG